MESVCGGGPLRPWRHSVRDFLPSLLAVCDGGRRGLQRRLAGSPDHIPFLPGRDLHLPFRPRRNWQPAGIVRRSHNIHLWRLSDHLSGHAASSAASLHLAAVSTAYRPPGGEPSFAGTRHRHRPDLGSGNHWGTPTDHFLYLFTDGGIPGCFLRQSTKLATGDRSIRDHADQRVRSLGSAASAGVPAAESDRPH